MCPHTCIHVLILLTIRELGVGAFVACGAALRKTCSAHPTRLAASTCCLKRMLPARAQAASAVAASVPALIRMLPTLTIRMLPTLTIRRLPARFLERMLPTLTLTGACIETHVRITARKLVAAQFGCSLALRDRWLRSCPHLPLLPSNLHLRQRRSLLLALGPPS